MRLLLLLTVLIAVITLLLLSWQRSKRVFAVAAASTMAVIAVLAYGVLNPGRHDQVTLSPDDIRIEVTDRVSSESGVRFTGVIFNDSELDLAGVTLQAKALVCPEDGRDCEVIDQQKQLLQLYIPAGRHYAFALVARHPAGAIRPTRWEVNVLSRLAYPGE